MHPHHRACHHGAKTLTASLSAIGLLAAFGMAAPAMAQADDRVHLEQASRIAEALKQAAVQGNTKQPGYYSDWQVKGDRIPLWSRQCLGEEITPQQFEANQATAGAIVVCILKDLVRQEIRSARNDESLMVRRVASWWVTGDGGRYNANGVSPYTQQILKLYQPGSTNIAARPSSGSNPSSSNPGQVVPTQESPAVANQPLTPPKTKPGAIIKPKPSVAKETAKPETAGAKPSAANGLIGKDPNTPIVIKSSETNFYDRYMQTGYTASRAKDYKRAMVFFRRALDERPGDAFATKAIANMEKVMPK
jgi:hypothetical protein